MQDQIQNLEQWVNNARNVLSQESADQLLEAIRTLQQRYILENHLRKRFYTVMERAALAPPCIGHKMICDAIGRQKGKIKVF